MNFTTLRHDTYPYIDPSKFDLSGKNVFITGASRGIGEATAISYAKAGASGIAIAARSPLEDVAKRVREAAISAGHRKPKILQLKLDVTDRANVEASAKEIAEAFADRLDILVNNAGYLSSFVSIPESDPDDWCRDWEVNVKGVYLITRALWPLLLKSSLKIIMNMTSIGALINPPHSSAYNLTKIGMMRFTELINQDHGKGTDDMLCIAVHPGGVPTPLALTMPKAIHSYLIDTPELAGDTLLWLGAERREWLGGRYVSAGWDMEELSEKEDEIVQGDLLKVRLAVNTFSS